MGSLQGGVSGTTLTLCGYYVVIATVTTSPLLTTSSKPIVVHRVSNSSRKLATRSVIWPPAKKELVMFFQRKGYQLPETLFDKLDLFNISHSDDQKLFKNMPIYDFESIGGEEDKSRDTDTTTWIGKHVPVSVSVCPN